MPESVAGTRWARRPLHDIARACAYRRLLTPADAPALARTADAPMLTGAAGPRTSEARHADRASQARSRHAEPVSAGVGSRGILIDHADADSAPAWDGAPWHRRDGTSGGVWPSVLSQDAFTPPLWRGRLLAGDLRKPPPPPPPYAPPYPVEHAPLYIGTALHALPCIRDYTAVPTPIYPGSEMETALRIPWGEAVPANQPLEIRWTRRPVIYGGAGPKDEDDLGIGTGTAAGWEDRDRAVIPTRTVYMILHSLSVVRLPDRTPLPWRSLSLRTDASQWAWVMSLELIGKGVSSLITPAGSDPIQIEIGINGATWICLAEDWSESSSFGNWTSTQVSGRSLSALLSSRYQRPRDYVEGSTLTMAQLAEQELPYGGGWNLTWYPADWTVPAGAWTYQGLSPIEAIAKLAQAAGGLVYADRNGQDLLVREWYKVLPWDMVPGAEDLLIPESAILGLSRRYRWPDQADAVYLYGGEVGGLQARVSRSGTAGSNYAPDVSEPLMTHTTGALALGGRILAGNSMPCGVATVTMAVDPTGDYPIAELGDLVRVAVDGGQMGPVSAVEIRVQGRGEGAPEVRQTLALGESANDYQRLLALMPQEPRILGEVTALNGDGTVTVATASGGAIRVRGSVAPGTWVWVRAGRVEGAAPTLPAFDLSI